MYINCYHKESKMNILAIGAHHDDIELGAGGTLARLVKEGHKVFGIILTNSETHYDIKNIHRTKSTAIKEGKTAAKIIGYKLLETPKKLAANNGELQYNSKFMRFLEDIIDEHNIDWLFTHWQYDMNTDHEASAKLSIVAARHLPRILMYRSNWYQPDRSFNGIMYSDISSTIEVKKLAIEAYAGEIKNRSREWANTFIDTNRSFGFSIGTAYAEVFEPVRFTI